VLLESIGFECVMQYNENRQRSRKNVDQPQSTDDNSDKPSNGDEEASSQTSADKEESTTESGAEKIANGDAEAGDLPELKRCTCTKCSKEFSSVWVLKAHEEEVHSTVLPIDSVEEFARQLRVHYDSRHAAAATASTEFRPGSEQPSKTKKTDSVTPGAVPQTSDTGGARSTRVTSGQLAADLAAMQQAAAQLMHLPLMMGMMGAATGPAAPPPAATAGMLPMMLPLSPEFFGIPPTFPAAALMDPATMMMLTQQQQQQQQQQRGLRTGSTGAVIPSTCAPTAPPPPPSQQPAKSARTRINDDQLAVLRAHFDINNSPSEEQIHAMSERTGLPPKVIKHWFRNTLFKERQRNKDSPYNFSVPPATTLNLDDYERTAPTAKRAAPDDTKPCVAEPPSKMAAVSAPETPTVDLPMKKEVTPSVSAATPRSMVTAPPGAIIPTPMFATDMSAAAAAAAFAGMCQLPPTVFPPMPGAPSAAQPPSTAIPSGVELHSHERRANRTRFTNHQIQVHLRIAFLS